MRQSWSKGAVVLLLRALDAFGAASKPPAAQAVELAPPAHNLHVLTVCSAPVDHVTHSAIFGPPFLMCVALPGLSSMQPRGISMLSA